MLDSPSIFCRSCGYILAALPENRCPECGRDFDPANPKTYRTRPPSSALRKWILRAGIPLLLLASTAAGGYLWLRNDWEMDVAARNAVRRNGLGTVTISRIGPDWLARLLGDSQSKLLDRATALNLRCRQLSPEEAAALWRLHHLQNLRLYYVRPTDEQARCLTAMPELRILNLSGNITLTDAALVHLRDQRHLHTLLLANIPITDSGLEHVAQIRPLESLSLAYTKITGKGLHRLLELEHLKALDLRRTSLSDEDIPELLRLQSLEELEISSTNITPQGALRLAALAHLRKLTFGFRVENQDAEFQTAFKTLRPDVALRS